MSKHQIVFIVTNEENLAEEVYLSYASAKRFADSSVMKYGGKFSIHAVCVKSDCVDRIPNVDYIYTDMRLAGAQWQTHKPVVASELVSIHVNSLENG